MKLSIPVNCPWGSACSCRVAPVHFRLPIGGPVLSLYVRAPLPECNEVDLLIPVNCCGAQHAPVVRPPFTFGRILRPGFEFSPCAHAGPRDAAVEDERFGLSGVLVMLSTLPYSSQILATRPVAASLRPRPVSRARSPPRLHVAHAGSRNKVIAGRGASCWPGTRPLQLLTVYCRTININMNINMDITWTWTWSWTWHWTRHGG